MEAMCCCCLRLVVVLILDGVDVTICDAGRAHPPPRSRIKSALNLPLHHLPLDLELAPPPRASTVSLEPRFHCLPRTMPPPRASTFAQTLKPHHSEEVRIRGPPLELHHIFRRAAARHSPLELVCSFAPSDVWQWRGGQRASSELAGSLCALYSLPPSTLATPPRRHHIPPLSLPPDVGSCGPRTTVET